jgi:hypothetical protein
MKTSQTISKISTALLKAQSQMGTATKDSENPFFKSKYADLNAIREACMPALLANGIVLLQPTISNDGRNYVETILIHESGEWLSSETEIIYSKVNDAQSQGSGITYARRYGMQSFLNVGADDDDGNKASTPQFDNSLVEIQKKLNICNNLDELGLLYDSLSSFEQGKSKALFTKRKIELNGK